MSKTSFNLVCLASVIAIGMPSLGSSAEPAEARPVLVELFTSEGCSSCPPADRLLQRLESQPIAGAHLIVLSEHVDYWDHLGWRDPFSSALFSKRQRNYSNTFGKDDVYTPQMVVNGRSEFVGNNGAAAEKEIRKAAEHPAATVRIGARTIDGSVATVQLSVADLPQQLSRRDELELMLAVTETGISSRPKAGENNGAALTHTNVVRSLVKVGRADPSSEAKVTLDPAWKRPGLRLVAFVQEKKSRIVWGAAQAPLEP